MDQIRVARFYVAGIALRTTNEDGQSSRDIPQLWQQFFKEQIAEAIPERESDAVYCVYTDYEEDFTKPYTTFLGYRVADLKNVPAHLAVAFVEGGNYTINVATGKFTEGSVYEAWTRIWNSDMPRAYTADFEVYGEETLAKGEGTVNIFVALK